MISKLKLAAFIMIILSLIPVSSFAREDNLEIHFTVSAFLGAITETALHYKTDYKPVTRILTSTVAASVPGLVKELIDDAKEDNYFSRDQFTADVIGAFAGSVIAHFVNDRIQVHINKQKDETRASLSYKF